MNKKIKKQLFFGLPLVVAAASTAAVIVVDQNSKSENSVFKSGNKDIQVIGSWDGTNLLPWEWYEQNYSNAPHFEEVLRPYAYKMFATRAAHNQSLENEIMRLHKHRPSGYIDNWRPEEVKDEVLTEEKLKSFMLENVTLSSNVYYYSYSTKYVKIHGYEYLSLKVKVFAKVYFNWPIKDYLPPQEATFNIPMSQEAYNHWNTSFDSLDEEVDKLSSIEFGRNYLLSPNKDGISQSGVLTEDVLNRYGAENVSKPFLNTDEFSYSYVTDIVDYSSVGLTDVKFVAILVQITNKNTNVRKDVYLSAPQTENGKAYIDYSRYIDKGAESVNNYIQDIIGSVQVPNPNTLTNVSNKIFNVTEAQKIGLKDFPFVSNRDWVYKYTGSIVHINGGKYYEVEVSVDNKNPIFSNQGALKRFDKFTIPLDNVARSNFGVDLAEINLEANRLKWVEAKNFIQYPENKGTTGNLTPQSVKDLGIEFANINFNGNFNYRYDWKKVDYFGVPFYDLKLIITNKTNPSLKRKVTLKIPCTEEGLNYVHYNSSNFESLIDSEQAKVNAEILRLEQFVQAEALPNISAPVTDVELTEDILNSYKIHTLLNHNLFTYKYSLVKADDGVYKMTIVVTSRINSNASNSVETYLGDDRKWQAVARAEREIAKLSLITQTAIVPDSRESMPLEMGTLYSDDVGAIYNLSPTHVDEDKFTYLLTTRRIDGGILEMQFNVISKELRNISFETKIYVGTNQTTFNSMIAHRVNYSDLIGSVISEANRISSYKPMKLSPIDDSEKLHVPFGDAEISQMDLKDKDSNNLVLDNTRFNYDYTKTKVSDGLYKITIGVSDKVNTEIRFTSESFFYAHDGSDRTEDEITRAEYNRLSGVFPNSWFTGNATLSTDAPFTQTVANEFHLGDLNLNSSRFDYEWTAEEFRSDILFVAISIIDKVNPRIRYTHAFLMPTNEQAFKECY